MEYYVVQDKPVVARSQPSRYGDVVNAYDVGSKIGIVDYKEGWYVTSSKTYIFRTSSLISYKKWEKEQKKKSNSLVPPELVMSLRKVGGEVEVGDTVVLNSDNVENEKDNTIIDSKYFIEKVPFTVTKVEGSSVTIRSIDTEFTVLASYLEITGSGDTGIVEQTKQTLTNLYNTMTGRTQEKATDLSIGNLDVVNLRSIYGMPYQFLPIADNRIDGSMSNRSLGRKYAEKIATRAPILVMQAGRADFLRGFDKESQDATLNDLITNSAAHILTAGSTAMEQMVNTPGKYYAFKVLPAQYYGAVGQMCFAMANLLGLGDYVLELGHNYSDKIGNLGFDWSKANGTKWFGFNAGAVGFYINSDAQINESFNNGTMPSSLAQKMNEFGRMGSELQFLLGGISNHTGFDFDKLADGNLTAEGLVLKGQVSNTGGLIDSIIDNVQTLMVGGRMIFPEMWSDSQFMRSYNVTIKLDSPDADNLSIFLNILVPLAHILAFVIPRSVGMNNYISPFLVRAYYKSMFHIDMGIITGCSIQKGDTGAWNQAGLPTQITVQLTIKDMYNIISLATGLGNNGIVGNPGQLDYIANLCGINIDEPELFGKAFQLWLRIINPLNSIPARLRLAWQGLQADVYQRWNSIFTGKAWS